MANKKWHEALAKTGILLRRTNDLQAQKDNLALRAQNFDGLERNTRQANRRRQKVLGLFPLPIRLLAR